MNYNFGDLSHKTVNVLIFISLRLERGAANVLLILRLFFLFASRCSLWVSGVGGEGWRLGVAFRIRASWWAVWGPAPPSQSFFPKCCAHPGAEGKRKRPGEGGVINVYLQARKCIQKFKKKSLSSPKKIYKVACFDINSKHQSWLYPFIQVEQIRLPNHNLRSWLTKSVVKSFFIILF